MKYLFPGLFLFLVGCDRILLSKVESASKEFASCEVHQVMPAECEGLKRAYEIASLEAVQAGIDSDRIAASEWIGYKLVVGDPDNSPYKRMKRSLESKPFYITPEDENFALLRDDCQDLKIDESLVDTPAKEVLYEMYQSLKQGYKVVGYVQRNRILTVLFSKLQQPCLPSPEYIDDEFPILTRNQLDNFKKGIYLQKAYRPEYREVKVEVFDTFSEAKERFNNISKPL